MHILRPTHDKHVSPYSKFAHKGMLAAILVDEGSECDIEEKPTDSTMSESTYCLMDLLLGQFLADCGSDISQELAADSELQRYVRAASCLMSEDPLVW